MLPSRYWDKVKKTDDCWHWMGAISAYGYPKFRITSDHVDTAYRVAWEDEHGPVPAGMQLDHTCHTLDLTCTAGPECVHRRCVNPAHLEVVTQPENARRAHLGFADVCRNGHPRTPDNTRIRRRGQKAAARDCLDCARDSQRQRRARESAVHESADDREG